MVSMLSICISNVTWLLNPASKLGFMYYIGEQLNWAYSCDLNLIWLPNPIHSLVLKFSYILQWFSVSYLPIFPTLHQRFFIPYTSRCTCQPDCMDSVPPCDLVGSWSTKKFPSHNLFKVGKCMSSRERTNYLNHRLLLNLRLSISGNEGEIPSTYSQFEFEHQGDLIPPASSVTATQTGGRRRQISDVENSRKESL